MPKRSPRTAKTVSERPPRSRARFYDASAIAKAYLDERETADVRAWLADGVVFVSRLSEVEVPSAIHRRFRDGLISETKRDAAIDACLEDMARWEVIELTSEIARRGIGLLEAHRIRAGDAIQLASALAAHDHATSDFSRFVAYDARLLAAARTEGLPIQDY